MENVEQSHALPLRLIEREDNLDCCMMFELKQLTTT